MYYPRHKVSVVLFVRYVPGPHKCVTHQSLPLSFLATFVFFYYVLPSRSRTSRAPKPVEWVSNLRSTRRLGAVSVRLSFWNVSCLHLYLTRDVVDCRTCTHAHNQHTHAHGTAVLLLVMCPFLGVHRKLSKVNIVPKGSLRITDKTLVVYLNCMQN